MALSALSELTEHYLRIGVLDKAEGSARRQLELDRLNEAAHLQLMTALSRQGQRNAVFSHYHTYVEQLLDELNLEPGEAVISLIEQIRSGSLEYPIRKGQEAKPGTLSPQAVGYLAPQTTFVAREAELAQLNFRLREALSNQTQVMFISGEAGSGKTALMHEFAFQAQQANPQLVVAMGSCNAFTGAGDPYLPFREILRMLDPDEERRWVAGAITRDMLINQYAEMLSALAQRNPLLILIDDLQWADSASMSLLFYLGRSLKNNRILILAAYRPGEATLGLPSGSEAEGQIPSLESLVGELKRQHGQNQLNLDQLTVEDGLNFINAYLEKAETLTPNSLDDGFRNKLFSITKGHPLFIVEVLREMQDQGHLTQDEHGRWVQRPTLNWDELPARVEAVIQQRIGRLNKIELDILSAASVEGVEFSGQVAARIMNMDELQVVRILSQDLEKRHGLVNEKGEVKDDGERLIWYQFHHGLIQQYLYQQLAPSERRLLHGKIADELEKFSLGKGQKFVIKLAHHHTEAGDSKKAALYLLQAGDNARTVYAHQEAIGHYRKAIHFLLESRDYEVCAQAMMKLGITYHTAFNYQQARQAYREGFALWRQVDSLQPDITLPPPPHPLRMAWQDPTSLDPTLGGINLAQPIVTQLFSGLVALSTDLEVMPDVAESWEVQEDGKKYIFHLRDDVYWSDGKQLTAGDFEFTFKRALAPATDAPVANMLLNEVKGARDFNQELDKDPDKIGIFALNDTTLVIELEEPISQFMQMLSYYVFLPVPKHVVEAHGPEWAELENIVTNGPFRLADWQKGKLILLERNTRYHGRFKGNVQQIELPLDLDVQEQFDKYTAGSLDLFHNWFPVLDNIDLFRQPETSELVSHPIFLTVFLVFNALRPPFDDTQVRRAFTMSINREMILNMLYQDFVQPATGGFVPPGMPGYSEGIALPFDPEQARRLLAESGYPRRKRFPKVVLNAQRLHKLVDTLQLQWQEILKTEIKAEFSSDAKKYMNMIRNRNFDIFLGGWAADYADPDNFLRICVKSWMPDWRDERYEDLLQQAKQTTDQAARVKIYQQADRILMQQAVIVPLFYNKRYILMKPWVKNFHSTAIKHPGYWKDVILESH
jgi:oligopeptide transport system substrate-binding protein